MNTVSGRTVVFIDLFVFEVSCYFGTSVGSKGSARVECLQVGVPGN